MDLKERADEAFRAKRFGEAVEGYSAAIDVERDRAVLYLNRAQAYLAMGKPCEGLSDCWHFLSRRQLSNDPQLLSKALFRMAKCSAQIHDKKMPHRAEGELPSQGATSALFFAASALSDTSGGMQKDLYRLLDGKYSHRKAVGPLPFGFVGENVSRAHSVDAFGSLEETLSLEGSPLDVTSPNVGDRMLLCAVGGSPMPFFFAPTLSLALTPNSRVDVIERSPIRLIWTIVMWYAFCTSLKYDSGDFFSSLLYDSSLSSCHRRTLLGLLEDLSLSQNGNEPFTLHSASHRPDLQGMLQLCASFWKVRLQRDELANPLHFHPWGDCTLVTGLPIGEELRLRKCEWSQLLPSISASQGPAVHFWIGDALEVLLNEPQSHFSAIYTNALVDSCGIWNVLSVMAPLMAPECTLFSSSSFGSPQSYQECIAPSYCDEGEVDALFGVFGLKVESAQTKPNGTLNMQYKRESASALPLEHIQATVIKLLTRLVLRYSVTPIRPLEVDNNALLLSGYQVPYHTALTILLCARCASLLYPNSAKHLLDVILLHDNFVGRPFIKHRHLAFRLAGSLGLFHWPDTFLSSQLFIPPTSVFWRVIRAIPASKSGNSTPAYHPLNLLLLFLDKRSASQAWEKQNSAGKSDLFMWILSQDSSQLQMLDQVEYHHTAQCLAFLWPEGDKAAALMRFALLIDLNTYRAITRIIEL